MILPILARAGTWMCFQRARTGSTREGEEAVKSQLNVYYGSQRCNGGREVKETILNEMRADSGAN